MSRTTTYPSPAAVHRQQVMADATALAQSLPPEGADPPKPPPLALAMALCDQVPWPDIEGVQGIGGLRWRTVHAVAAALERGETVSCIDVGRVWPVGVGAEFYHRAEGGCSRLWTGVTE